MSTDNQKNPELTKDQQKPTTSEDATSNAEQHDEKSVQVSLGFSELEDRIAPAKII